MTEFPDTVVPRDFDTVELPLPERDRPHLLRGGERVPAAPAPPAPTPAG